MGGNPGGKNLSQQKRKEKKKENSSTLRSLCRRAPARHCPLHPRGFFQGFSQQGVPREILQAVPAEFFFFHPPVLEPDFNLAVGEVQHPGQLQPLLFVDVDVEEEFPLQLPDLEFRVGAALLPRPGSTWGKEGKAGSGIPEE